MEWWRNSHLSPNAFQEWLGGDATTEFQAKPSVASAHFTEHPEDQRLVCVRTWANNWWHNSHASRNVFLPWLGANATDEFQGMPSLATDHFTEHPEDTRVVRVMCGVNGTWWRNSLLAPKAFLEWLGPNATQPELFAQYIEALHAYPEISGQELKQILEYCW